MSGFLTTAKNIFGTKPLRRRLLYTVFFVIIYRLGTYILLPWVNPTKVFEMLKGKKGESFWDRLIGTNLNSCSIFSLGVAPYISASIGIQMCTFAIPYFQRLQQEGMAGKGKLNRITRQITVLVAVIQGTIRVLGLSPESVLGGDKSLFWFYVTSVLLMTAGAMFSVWLADCITAKGLGNGTSVLMMIGIICRLPGALVIEVKKQSVMFLLIEFVFLIGIILLVIIFMQATRKIILQYARQRSTMYTYGGARQYLPVKMNATGVMPIIFASLVVGFVAFSVDVLHNKFEWGWSETLKQTLGNIDGWQCNAMKAILIFLGTFMYATIFINPVKISDDLKRSNGFIAGVKPGYPTAKYIDKIVSLVLFPGALFLAATAMLPSLVSSKMIGVSNEFSGFYGGTSMLIIIGVILEIVQQVEGHLHMVYYDKIMEKTHTMPEL